MWGAAPGTSLSNPDFWMNERGDERRNIIAISPASFASRTPLDMFFIECCHWSYLVSNAGSSLGFGDKEDGF